VEAVVVHFLHSYANPQHEHRAREIVRRLWPNGFVTVGSEIVAEYREYERGTTAAINAYVQPIMHRYLTRLDRDLREQGSNSELLVMQGNGGTTAVTVAVEHPVTTLMSGPAAGVKAAAYTAGRAGWRNVISCDMGGTSFDVGVIRDGEPSVSAELEM